MVYTNNAAYAAIHAPLRLSDFEANKRGSNVHLDKNPKNIPALLQLITKAEWTC